MGEEFAPPAPVARDVLRWEGTEWGILRFAVSAHLGHLPSDLGVVSSVRAVVRRNGQVLVLDSPDGPHVWPGGRREAGETLAETVLREVHEETGHVIELVALLGSVRFVHQQPRPDGYAFPYPEFLQAVFVADAVTAPAVDGWSDLDGWELRAQFRDRNNLTCLDRVQEVFLAAAFQA